MKQWVYRLCVAQYIFYDINYSSYSRMYSHPQYGLFSDTPPRVEYGTARV